MDPLYIVGCRGALQLRGSLLGIPPGYKATKLNISNWSHVFSTSRVVSSIQRLLIRTVNCDDTREIKAT